MRTFLFTSRLFWVLSFGVSLLSLFNERTVVASTDAETKERPNLLLLLSDDHSYPFVQCYGDENVRTPNLDALAARGFKGHRFFTTCPQCVPSRASLMTGRSPVAARMTRFTATLPADEVTLPEVLKKEGGYYVGTCGRSYHLDGGNVQNNPVLARVLEENGLRTFKDRLDFVENGSDPNVPSLVAKFLDARPSDKPFFLWANFSDPHHIWNAPASYRPDPASLKIPSHLPDLPGVREEVANYCAEINRLDESIGKVLKELEKRNLIDSTVILFIGDNGGAFPHGKGSLYDPGSNVPCIAAGPGIKQGGDSRALLSGEDVAPTFLEAAGLQAPNRMTGVSFWGHLTDGKYEPREHLFVERGPHGSTPVSTGMASSGFDLGRAVRSDRYKFIYNCTPWIPYSPVDSANGPAWQEMRGAKEDGTLAAELVGTYFTTPRPAVELYDLEKDPAELKNLAGTAEAAEIENSLRAALIEKMVLDYDYLPLPAPFSEAGGRTNQPGRNRGEGGGNRERRFQQLDANRDGKLSFEEFRGNRTVEEARRWFELRDGNKDGFVDLEEYVPQSPR